MKELILIGGGGHCKACIEVIESQCKYRIAGILDVPEKVGSMLLGYKYVGTDEDIQSFVDAGAHFLITVGQVKSDSARANLAKELEVRGAKLATVVSSRAHVSRSAFVASGTIVMHDTLINADSKVGSHCIINSKALVEHDCVIGDFCHISTGVVINGNVLVGSGSFVGSNAVTKQGVRIPENSFIKAGSCFSGRK